MKLSEAIRKWKRNITTNTTVEYALALRADINAFSDAAQALERENVKLRELCSALYEFAYDEYPDSAELNFADRMRELKVEVPTRRSSND